MPWPFLYFAGDRLSVAELCAARLDGDLVEVGEAFMPADAVETRELRAGSLALSIPAGVALARASAAWVHGAIPDPPSRHIVQRASPRRGHAVRDPRLIHHDQRLAETEFEQIGGVAVTTPVRTLADLVRDHLADGGGLAIVDAMLAWRPELTLATADALEAGGAVHFKRPAVQFLRARAQAEVTRYTS
ncbi:SAM-dependent methyltransferase [Microbacterium sp.]|uniref:SAM-dependent methyltransferase n=1 Tax=Microbacterium sp. TaxID=51671 RepID=UPI003C7821D0